MGNEESEHEGNFQWKQQKKEKHEDTIRKRGGGEIKANKWREGNKGAEVQGQDKWLKHDPESRDACTHLTFRSNGSIPMIRGFGMGGRKYSFILKVNVDREEVWTCQYANKNNTFILPRCNSVTLRRDKTYRRSLICPHWGVKLIFIFHSVFLWSLWKVLMENIILNHFLL